MADYSQARWTGDVTARFWSKVERRGVDECWEWRGTLTPGGYGQFSIDNTHYAAHRLLYCKERAVLSPTQVCDHLCRNRRCVNPAHLEPVSNRENLARGEGAALLKMRNQAVTHCPQGHEYTPENTRRDAKGSRNCKTCERARSAQWTERRRVLRARSTQGDQP